MIGARRWRAPTRRGWRVRCKERSATRRYKGKAKKEETELLFQFDDDDVEGLGADVFGQVFAGGGEAGVTHFGVDEFGFAVGEGELGILIGEEDGDGIRVFVHGGFFAGGVADADDANFVVFKDEFVVFGVGFDGVLCAGEGDDKEQGQHQEKQASSTHFLPPREIRGN